MSDGKGVRTLMILQPLFLPWVGMFNMMYQSDLFVILDNAQFSRQSWQQRNRIKTQTGVRWLTVPVKHNFGEKIMNVEVDYSTNWREKHLGLIYQSYKTAPFFSEVYDLLQKAYAKKPALLCQFNVSLLNDLRGYLGIGTPLVLASEVPIENRGGKDHVLDLCKYFGTKSYLNGPAGKTLYSLEEFKQAGINLIFHEYRHPIYPQPQGEFVSHLSIIDVLFNCGLQGIELIYKQNVQN